MTPFQALYGFTPQLPTISNATSTVAAVEEVLQQRREMDLALKEALTKAQGCMKQFADAHMSEREFQLGDWVYLKIQPYRQLSLAVRGSQKLAAKYFGPFQIIAKLSVAAYNLQLPNTRKIHRVPCLLTQEKA